jgi:hypothetical protein
VNIDTLAFLNENWEKEAVSKSFSFFGFGVAKVLE